MAKSAAEEHLKNLAEETLYGIAATELGSGNISRGLYGKALAESDGDVQKAQALY